MLDEGKDMTTGGDEDAQRLEALLDGELSPAEEAAVLAGIESDPDLARRLGELRHDRDARRQVFARLEPSDQDVDGLLSRVRRAAEREQIWTRRARRLRLAGALAACILVGFFTGWIGHARTPHSGPPVDGLTTIAPRPVSNGGGAASAAPAGAFYRVQLTDEQGRVVAVQDFDTLEKARQFQDDVRRWQEWQRRVQQGDVQTTGSRF